MNHLLVSHTRKFAGLLAMFLFVSCELGAPTKGGGTEGEGVVGTIVDPMGAPVAGVWVKAYPLSGTGDNLAKASASSASGAAVVESVQTTASGTYRFPTLPAGTYNFVATATQNGTTFSLLVQGLVVTTQGVSRGRDTVKVSGSVSLQIQAEGQGIENAWCYIPSSPWSAMSSTAGICTISGLPPGIVHINILHPSIPSGLTQTHTIVSGTTTNGGPVIVVPVTTVSHPVRATWPDTIASVTGADGWALRPKRFLYRLNGVTVKDTVMNPYFPAPGEFTFILNGIHVFRRDTLELFIYGTAEGGPFDLMSGWDTTRPIYQGVLEISTLDLLFNETLSVGMVWVGPTALPTAPSPLSPGETTVAPLSGALIWSRIPNADAYNVQLSRDSTFGSLLIDDNIWVDSLRSYGPLNGGGTYYWRVRAMGWIGFSPWSVTRSFVTVGSAGTPIPPSTSALSLIAPADSAGSVALNPSLKIGIMGGINASYRLQVSTDTAFTQRAVDDSLPTSAATGPVTYERTVGPLSPKTTYFWRVLMIKPDSVSSSVTRRFTTQDSTGTDTIPTTSAGNAIWIQGFTAGNQAEESGTPWINSLVDIRVRPLQWLMVLKQARRTDALWRLDLSDLIPS